ncbi:MAG TPA: MBL fold metallo-hydrolase [Dehalococcoidia bacterium]|nr:MBL fold metallo-hydrolase [Dehalococcoidia bacterium]
MGAEIHKLPMGICNCYLIKEKEVILVDAGPPKQVGKFRTALQKLSTEPHDISLMLITHGHYDHIGSVSEVKALTGCKVAINHREKEWVEQALRPMPPGIGIWGTVMAALMRAMVPFMKFPASSVDIELGDEEFPLQPFGVNGKFIYTPGHTSGSMSLLLETGEAFVGDLAMSSLPMRIGPGMPIFGDDRDTIKASWRLLLDNGAKWIYPAHGNPFSAEVLSKAL